MSTPVFIGGFRSGSTLLINLLGLHPEIAPWFETKELCEALRWLRVLTNPAVFSEEAALMQPIHPAGFDAAAVAARMRWHVDYNFRRLSGAEASGKAAYERYPLGADCILYSREEALQAVRRWELQADTTDLQRIGQVTGWLIRFLGKRQAELMGRPLWINKTPEISRFGDVLWDSLGPCRVILLIRNGWDVVRSAAALGWGDVGKLSQWWKGLIVQSRKVAREGYYLEIRYENLVDRPEETLWTVLRFLNLPQDNDDVFFQRCRAQMMFGNQRARHSCCFHEADRAIFDRVAADLMHSLGYH
ncbi:hypothetical protein MIT9_P0226 [Methylomarinovum caldicuralii]|uniref:Sulfotransferase n=1 Tax=Methylomarinovum caldicuralii TaxID=438856 RepID=A0AAU9CMG6_9GAMM|nr:sulfotransferase [Methylomarinovum caldicuralii]BCX80652.1 hypothetical protein MIT9_P0226 [Methylomarinovum caldicuralii]